MFISTLLVLTTGIFLASCSGLGGINLSSSTNKSGTDVEYLQPNESAPDKTTTTIDTSKIQKLAGPTNDGLDAATVVIPAGSLSISTTIVMEQGTSFSDTNMTTEVGLTTDVAVSAASGGLIIRPSTNVTLQNPMTISLPLPTLAQLQDGGSRYAIAYKFYDPTLKALVTGIRLVDGSNVIVSTDARTGKQIVSMAGYFGIYWSIILGKDVLPSAMPAQKTASEPILNKAKVAVMDVAGVVAETDVKTRETTAAVVWSKVAISFDDSSRVLSLAATIDSARTVTACRVDIFKSPTAGSGVSVKSPNGLTFQYTVSDVSEQTLYGRFLCLDDLGRLTTSAWSDVLNLAAVATDNTPAAAAGLSLAWRGGSKLKEQASIISGTGKTPSARRGASTWTDADGNLWLFGGFAVNQTNPSNISAQDFASDLWKFNPTSLEWTMVKGSTDIGTAGVYTGSASALLPAARYNANAWFANGRLYLFGGNGYTDTTTNGDMSDLWYFDITAGNWTLVSGTAAFNAASVDTGTGAHPSARSHSSVATIAGKVWLFGGISASVYKNDIWLFDPSTNLWTLKQAPRTAASDYPAARASAVTWSSGTKLYFHGGNITANAGVTFSQETWKIETSSGTPVCTRLGNSDDLGASGFSTSASMVFAANNQPGRLADSASWKDSAGRLWFYGGIGSHATSGNTTGRIAATWVLDPTTDQWAYVGDSNDIGSFDLIPTYGELNAFANLSVGKSHMGSRSEHMAWYSAGRAWVFGGAGLEAVVGATPKIMNNFWEVHLP